MVWPACAPRSFSNTGNKAPNFISFLNPPAPGTAGLFVLEGPDLDRRPRGPAPLPATCGKRVTRPLTGVNQMETMHPAKLAGSDVPSVVSRFRSGALGARSYAIRQDARCGAAGSHGRGRHYAHWILRLRSLTAPLTHGGDITPAILFARPTPCNTSGSHLADY